MSFRQPVTTSQSKKEAINYSLYFLQPAFSCLKHMNARSSSRIILWDFIFRSSARRTFRIFDSSKKAICCLLFPKQGSEKRQNICFSQHHIKSFASFQPNRKRQFILRNRMRLYPLHQARTRTKYSKLSYLKQMISSTKLGCGIWLGISQINFPQQSSNQFSEKELEWNLFVSKEIGKLISFISKSTTKAFTTPPSESIKLCVEQATDGVISPFSRLIQTHLITFYGWLVGKQKPRLKDVLKICYCLNLTLLDFFDQPDTIKIREQEIREWIGIDRKAPRPTPQPFNREQVRSKLKKFINNYPPLSLSEVCRRIGYDRGVIVKSFPEIQDRIKSNYNEYQKQLCENRKKALEEEIRLAVQKIEANGSFVSAGRVAKFLNKPSYKNRRDVARIVFNVRQISKTIKN